MQQKIVIDTNIYIDIFNNRLHEEEINWFTRITFLAHPVLHELWMSAKGQKEIKYLTGWSNKFIKLKRLIVPTTITQLHIGQTYQRLRKAGKIDPAHPKHYNDISIALLARQVGATVLTKNDKNFSAIQKVIDFNFQRVK